MEHPSTIDLWLRVARSIPAAPGVGQRAAPSPRISATRISPRGLPSPHRPIKEIPTGSFGRRGPVNLQDSRLPAFAAIAPKIGIRISTEEATGLPSSIAGKNRQGRNASSRFRLSAGLSVGCTSSTTELPSAATSNRATATTSIFWRRRPSGSSGSGLKRARAESLPPPGPSRGAALRARSGPQRFRRFPMPCSARFLRALSRDAWVEGAECVLCESVPEARHRYRFVRSLLARCARTRDFHNSSIERCRTDFGARRPRDHLQEYEKECKRYKDRCGKRTSRRGKSRFAKPPNACWPALPARPIANGCSVRQPPRGRWRTSLSTWTGTSTRCWRSDFSRVQSTAGRRT